VPTPVPTDSLNWTIAGFWMAVLAFFGVLLRQIGPWRKQISDLEERLRLELLQERRRCEAELRVVRHRTRNQRQIIYSLLHLFDLPATRRKELLASIRADLAALEQAEATESGIVASALGDSV
jgi:hypothetical protein